ncbi:hypothetical protein OG216_11600 [Streptomycetaceae bacterium NBC_01309]
MSPYSDDRLPGHDYRRRQLMAALDADQAQTDSVGMSRRVAVPLAATAAVIVASGVGVLAAQPWADGADSTGVSSLVPGETGVPRESARVGDPVPGDLAGAALTGCLKNGAETAREWNGGGNAPPPSPLTPYQTPMGTAPPTGLPTETKPGPGLSSPPASGPPANSSPDPKPSGPSGTPAMPPPPDSRSGGKPGHQPPHLGKLPEKTSAYRPVLTAWVDNGAGGLTPFVIGKARGPGVVACVGEAKKSEPLNMYLDEREPEATEPRIGDNEFPALKPGTTNSTDPSSVSSVILWGYADPEVARVEVSTEGGPPVPADVRNGAWAVNGPFAYSVADDRRTEIRAYDASGTLLVQGGR